MADTIESLLSQMYHPGLKAIDPGLDRVISYLKLLGSPQLRLPPVIHVAGTNGKGSLIANLQSIFTQAGYRVHRYTSPHLVRFNERIVINGEPISDEYLKALLERVVGYIQEQPVTFFEATTAAAFLAFAEHPADVLLLETGMGGRLDATNVIDKPILTAITPISLDHCNFLGPTVEIIAYEKAGIMKSSVPCVVGRQTPDAAAVLTEQARRLHAPLYRYGHEWTLTGQGVYQSSKRSITVTPALAGDHQFDNAATAIACIDQLAQFSISDTQIQQGVANTLWPGRLQPLKQGKLAALLPEGTELWLDGGHNPQGGEMLARWFASRGDVEIHVICGMVKGKETGAYLASMAPYIKQLYAIAIPQEELSQPPEQVLMAAQEAGIRAEVAASMEKALQTIGSRAKTPAIICICGSLYLAGRVLAANE